MPNGNGIRSCNKEIQMGKIVLNIESTSEQQTERLGSIFARLLKKGDFIALNGELGAGKTAFVRGICSVFCPGERVCSPTYTVMRQYKGKVCTFYHFDMYRITSEEDLESVGFYDCDGVIAAEWCENTPYALPTSYYQVEISKTGEESRKIEILRIEAEEEVKS